MTDIETGSVSNDSRASLPKKIGVKGRFGSGVQWREPEPLPGTRPLAAFPVGELGDVVAWFVSAVAEETATPVDLSAIAALGTVSTCIAGSVVVVPQPGWREPVSLYLLSLAEPGVGKTPAMNKFRAILDTIERDRQERALPLITAATAKRRIASKRLEHLVRVAAKAGPEDRDEAERAVDDAAAELAGIVVPPLPRLYTRDATPEALVKLMAEQGGPMAIFSDEAADFFQMPRRYSGSGKGNLSVYVDGADSKRHVSDRSGREPVVIERATLTVCLLGQPVVLHNLARDHQMAGRGVMARILWSRPRSLVGYRDMMRPPVPEETSSAWDELIMGLAREAQDATAPIALSLNDEAASLFAAFMAFNETRLRPDGDLSSVTEWGSKLPGHVLRLAANLHAMHTGTLSGSISQATMASALAIGDYFTDHALGVFAEMQADPGLEDALQVWRWIEARGATGFSTRDVYRSKGWDPFRTRKALYEISNRDWIQQCYERRGPGRPTELWEVHPWLLGQNLPEPELEDDMAGTGGQIDVPGVVAPFHDAIPACAGLAHVLTSTVTFEEEVEYWDRVSRIQQQNGDGEDDEGMKTPTTPPEKDPSLPGPRPRPAEDDGVN